MSTRVLALCWEYPAETAAEKLILLKIGDQSNDHGQSIYFSMKTYARAGLLRSTRGARKIMRRLEEKQILLDDPEFAAELRAKGRAVRARVYRLNLPKIREAIEEANRNPVPIDDYGEPELSSDSGDETNRNSVPIESELSSANTYLESFTDNPLNPPEQDFTEDFEKLVAAWKPFDMLTGALPQAKRKYTKIRGEGVSAEQVMLAARVYCQQCWNTRCKTKHIENWLGQCVWKSEDKGLREGSNGKSRDKKPLPAEAEKPRALRNQPWHATAKQQLGDTVYRAWIERLWLEGDIVYCPTRFAAEYVQQQYGRAIIAAIGHEVRYVAELPPQHAFADFVEQSAGENHGQDQITA